MKVKPKNNCTGKCIEITAPARGTNINKRCKYFEKCLENPYLKISQDIANCDIHKNN